MVLRAEGPEALCSAAAIDPFLGQRSHLRALADPGISGSLPLVGMSSTTLETTASPACKQQRLGSMVLGPCCLCGRGQCLRGCRSAHA